MGQGCSEHSPFLHYKLAFQTSVHICGSQSWRSGRVEHWGNILRIDGGAAIPTCEDLGPAATATHVFKAWEPHIAWGIWMRDWWILYRHNKTLKILRYRNISTWANLPIPANQSLLPFNNTKNGGIRNTLARSQRWCSMAVTQAQDWIRTEWSGWRLVCKPDTARAHAQCCFVDF